jgi:hypothetical protein
MENIKIANFFSFESIQFEFIKLDSNKQKFFKRQEQKQ